MTAPTGGTLSSAVVRVVADTTAFARTVRTGLQTAFTTAARALRLDALVRAARSAGSQAGDEFGDEFVRAADGRLRDSRGRFVSEGAAAGNGFFSGFSGGGGSGLLGLFGSITGALGPLAAKAAIAAKALLTILPVLAQLGSASLGIVATLPAIAVGFLVVSKTISAAVKGMSEAFSAAASGDVEAFNEALKALAPSAQGVAREFAQVAPQFKGIQQAIQQEFFTPLTGALSNLAATPLFGQLKSSLGSLAGNLGTAVGNVFVKLNEYASDGSVPAFLESISRGFVALFNTLPSVTTALAELLINGAEPASTVLSVLAGGIEKLADKLTNFAVSGGLSEFIQNGLDTFQTLGAVLGDIGSILGSVFGALSQGGGNALGVFGALTSSLADFLKTAEGASALDAIGQVLGVIGQLAGTVFSTVLPLVGELVSGIGGPLAAALQSIVPALGGVVSALGGALMPIIKVFAPLIGQVATILGTTLAPILDIVAGLFLKIAPVAEKMANVLGPILGVALGIISDVLIALMPLIEALLGVMIALLPVVVALLPLIELLGKLIGLLASFLVPVIAFLASLLAGLLSIVTSGIVDFLVFLVGIIMKIPDALAFLGEFFANVWNKIYEVVSSGVSNIVNFLTTFPGKVIFAIAGLVVQANQFFTNLFAGIRNFVSNGIQSVISAFAALPGRIGAFAGQMFNAAASLGAAIGRGLQNIGGFASDIGGKIVGFIKSGINRIIGSINSGIGSLDAALPIGLPRIPFLAKGGIIDQATLAVVGEAGREVVLPLTDPRRTAQLAEESGLLDMLGRAGFGGAPVVNVTAILDGFGVMRVVDQRVSTAMDSTARELAMGVR